MDGRWHTEHLCTNRTKDQRWRRVYSWSYGQRPSSSTQSTRATGRKRGGHGSTHLSNLYARPYRPYLFHWLLFTNAEEDQNIETRRRYKCHETEHNLNPWTQIHRATKKSSSGWRLSGLRNSLRTFSSPYGTFHIPINIKRPKVEILHEQGG